MKIPQESSDLAEFIGVEFGDGGVSNPWQVVISLNSLLDKEYSIYLKSLIKKLFGIIPYTRKRPGRNNLIIVSTGINLVDFLVSRGVCRGNKIIQKKFDIPIWINNNSSYKRMFVRGLVDTDGCLYIHQHNVAGKNYKNIGFCFTSYSNKLLKSVYKVLLENGLKAHLRLIKHMVNLYSAREVVKYLQIFGSSNPRIYRKYEEWKGARAVYSADLESLYGRKAIRGSNPLPSAFASPKF